MEDRNLDFLNLINSKLIKAIIRFLPFVSLLITNFIILLIFSYFFNIPIGNLYFWALFVIGFLFSLLTIKTNYILYWKTKEGIRNRIVSLIKSLVSKKDKKIEEKNKKNESNGIPKIGFLNSIILLIKNLYFNILNDFFILTIIWISLISFFYILNFIEIPNNFNFQNFATTITLIGVLSGFFQYYIKNYREQVSMKIADSISKYLSSIVKKINFKDFMSFLKDLYDNDNKIQEWFKNKNCHNISSQKKNIKSLIDRINKIILDEDTKKKKQNQIGGITYIHQTFLSFKIDASYLFDYLDYYKEFKKQNGESFNKQLLEECYKVYFERKLEEFKEKLNKEDLTEIRKIIFSSIFFFDEVFANLEKTLLEFRSLEKEELGDFRDFYNRFTYDCINYMLNVLLNFKQEYQKEG